ncbi:DUF1731 domain-containing protein [Georgenia sp. 10Sc9-8]|uniref:DUF1731 domain-containing protein n=1 Tax=Georgenia halotolerans TaxID=3028317 RepID=A0ABT5TWG8_9MICO|nr:DUF1731 domain-containing protein [Georgenia halotolerans]
MHRPAVLRVPRWALRLALGEFADDILSSQQVIPEKLLADGFSYLHPTLPAAARWVSR